MLFVERARTSTEIADAPPERLALVSARPPVFVARQTSRMKGAFGILREERWFGEVFRAERLPDSYGAHAWIHVDRKRGAALEQQCYWAW